MALLVLHIACVLVADGRSENLPMYRYFTNPAQFKPPCVLAHCKEEMRSVFEYQSLVKNAVCITCACGARLAFKNNANEKKYPHCPEEMAEETRGTSLQTATTQSMSSNGDTNPEWEHCTKQMSPAVYRALRLIVYSFYYAGISLKTSEQEASSFLSMLHGLDIKSCSTADFCFEQMESDLSCLTKILNCKKDVAIQTMHLVVEKSSDLIRGVNLLEANDCSTPKMRREWESMFSQLTETVLLNTRIRSKEVKEMMKLQQTEDNDEITLECRILELDNYPQKPEEQNTELKRLFRVTKLPCFEDFRSAFLLSSKDVHVKHSFLTLFFKKIDELLDIGHLHHLLKWSRLVSSALTHRISRKDAQFKSIDDFITGHLLEIERSKEERESLEKLFDDFKKAWNKMCPLVNQEPGNKTERKMPYLARTDHLGYCLTESDCATYLETAIKILVARQNSILDAIISLSSEQQHKALSFVEYKNGSGIMSTTLQDVQEKEIINFEWSDDVFMFAQNNLEYGKGQEIKYDFERIEKWLARKVAFGKCYLTEKLNKFIFANELFHFCGTLLIEIRSLVTQSPKLPDEVLKGVSTLKTERIKDAQDLLQHIEVLMFLQKRKLNDFTVDMTLEELVNRWTSILPNPFPVEKLPKPSSLIMIKHVVALYEALEDVLSDAAVDALDDRFKEKLPEEYLALLMKEIDQLKPNNVLKVLRRYLFRNFSSEQYKSIAKESDSLQSCLKDPSLWSPLEPPNLGGIPKEIALKHIHFIVKHLETFLQKDNEEKTSRPSPDRPSRGKRQGGTGYHGC